VRQWRQAIEERIRLLRKLAALENRLDRVARKRAAPVA